MRAVVFDADAVIAALDRSDAHHAEAAATIRSLLASEVELLVSAVNYAEALVAPAREAADLRKAVDAIAALGISAVPATAAIAREAALIRRERVSLPDGFALATAKARSAAVLTFDQRVLRAMARMELKRADR